MDVSAQICITMHCKMLGLTSPPLSEFQLRRAYKNQAKLWHPDRHIGKSEREQTVAESRMIHINEAVDFFTKYLESPEPEPEPEPIVTVTEDPTDVPSLLSAILSHDIQTRLATIWNRDVMKLQMAYPRIQPREIRYLIMLKSILVDQMHGHIPPELDDLISSNDSRKVMETWFMGAGIGVPRIPQNSRISNMVMNSKETLYDLIRTMPIMQECAVDYATYCIQQQMSLYPTMINRGDKPHPSEISIVRWMMQHI